jgi:predicted kinase
MSMSWKELRKEADNLSTSDRLALVEAIIRSLQNELKPRSTVSDEVWDRLRGSLKTDAPPPSDREIDALLEQRREEKYR